MSPTERQILDLLSQRNSPYDGEHYCVPFAPLMRESGLARNVVRRACRSLARKGYAQFYKGLWTEDGEPAGAGYCISPKGVELLETAQ